MKYWYNLSSNDVIKELKSHKEKGLTKEQQEENRELFGDNETLNLKYNSFVILFLKNIAKLYCILGLLLGFLALYKNEYYSAIFLYAATFFSLLFYTVEDYKNNNRINNLKGITPIKASVVREGKEDNISPEDLVVGDIVYIKRGDIVPGDLRLIVCDDLKIKESAITGNSEVIEKYETKIEDRDILPSEMKNIAFKSSFVMDGWGKGIAIAVGDNTEIGKVTKDLLHENNHKEKHISSRAATYTIAACNHITAIISFISLIIKKEMKKINVEFRELSSIEKLAGTDVVIINKIGSLTEDYMYIKRFFTNGKTLDKTSNIMEENKDNVNRMLNIGLLCNDYKLVKDGQPKGNIVERSIIIYGEGNSLEKRLLEKEQQRILDIPYDNDKRIKTTLNKVEDKYRANVVGAVDKLLERCTHIMKSGIEVEISAEDVKNIKDGDLELSKESLYVIGLAYRNFNYEPTINENIESNLVFVGLMAFENPIKENLIDAMDCCKGLAIKPVIITHDNKIAAESAGKNLGILNKNDMVLSGVEIDNMEDEELGKFVEKIGVYSRISSKNKRNIVREFKKLGYNVAVTGNKFTDIPSFRAGNIGIASGEDCTKIAKEFGDVFIDDMDFLKLLSSIDKSRKITKSIENIIFFNLVIVIIELLSLVVCIPWFNSSFISLKDILFNNFITLTLSSLLIYNNKDNIQGQNYQWESIKEGIFKRFNSTIVMYIIFITTALSITTIFQSKKGYLIEGVSYFTILNVSSIAFTFYFVKLRDVIKNKLSIIVLLLNIIFLGIFII